MNPKQIAIEALEEAIDYAEKQLGALKSKLEAVKGTTQSAAPNNNGGGLPPDPTHPHG